jgi:hypothetical protein
MRATIAAVAGAVAGAVLVGVLVTRLNDATPPAAQTSAAPDPEMLRTLARIEARLDRLERRADAERHEVAPAASPVGAEEPAADKAIVPVADFTKTSTADLALDADERHARDFDVAGAAKRYLELLARGGTPSERRHWFIRLGDCYVRLQHEDQAAQAYRDCVDASTEDHPERVACMISLARRQISADPAEALRWIDRALELKSGRDNETVHRLGADLASMRHDDAREIRDLDWLVENAGAAPMWTSRLAELRGEKR